MMAFSNENVIGFALALSSSGFIGSSFIIKKKGLWKAGASGVRAGVGGYSYLFEPLWWLGLSMMIIGEIANFVAYAFAPAILVTPLGALSIIVSISVLIPTFLLYAVSVVVLVFILVLYFAPMCGHTNVLVFTGICSLMGSLSVMSVKALGISLKLTIEGNNQLFYPETWFFTLVLMTCVITQMNYLNKALDSFDTVVVSPIYYVMFTTLTILASVIMFKDWDGQDGGAIASEICGFIVVISGTMLLQMTKEIIEKMPSFKGGNYAPPMSPTLTAGLCAGNTDFRKTDWDDVENPEVVLLSKQFSSS